MSRNRIPGSRVIAFATWLLALLGAGLMYVSFDAQYQFILAQKDASGRVADRGGDAGRGHGHLVRAGHRARPSGQAVSAASGS